MDGYLEVTCQFCSETQEYKGQEYCHKCKGRFSMWHLRRELGLNPPKPQKVNGELRKV